MKPFVFTQVGAKRVNVVNSIQERGGYLFKLPDKRVMVFDCPPLVGARQMYKIIKEKFKREKIEGIMISHYDFDHFGGIAGLMDRFNGEVGKVYSSGHRYRYRNEEHTTLTQTIFDKFADKGKNVEIQFSANSGINNVAAMDINEKWVTQGDFIIKDDKNNFEIEVLNPTTEEVEAPVENDSNQHQLCLSIIIRYGNFKTLLYGDLNKNKIKNNIIPYLNGEQITFLQLSHHGDPGKLDKEILNKMDPELVLIESYKGLEKTINFLEKEGFDYHRLDTQGTFWAECYPTGRWIKK